MNFVGFTTFFPPHAGAESLCTYRFFMGLARAGHHVHIVTYENPEDIDPETMKLLDLDCFKITFLGKLPPSTPILNRFFKRNPNLNWKTNHHIDAESVLIDVLKMYADPILISRPPPTQSHFPCLAAKKYAKLWIAHFGDPDPIAPIMASYSRYKKFSSLFSKFQISRILNNADLISITCPNAILFFTEMYGQQIAEKMILVPHIGTPSFPAKECDVFPFASSKFIFSHIGSLLPERYPEKIISAFEKLANARRDFIFYIYGSFPEMFDERIQKNDAFIKVIHSPLTPSLSTDFMSRSGCNLIVDAQTTLSYCPFLPSKYVYAVESGTPLLGFTEKNSAIYHDYSDFQSTYFADVNQSDSLFETLNLILDHRDHLLSPSLALQKKYSQEEIISAFLKKLVHFL